MPDQAVTGSEYYIRREKFLMRGFDWISKRMGRRLEFHYGADFADETISATREEFQRIIPQLPYIGGIRNVFTPVIVVNGWMVALHRAMRLRGKSTEDVVHICCEVSDDFFAAVPSRLLRFIGRLAFTPISRWFFKRQAARSQDRRYDEDFVYEVKANGSDYDLALVFSECAVNKFYDAQGEEELKPYCNFFDVTYSRFMGMGVNANDSIGAGCKYCNMRFNRDVPTTIPEPLKTLLPDRTDVAVRD